MISFPGCIAVDLTPAVLVRCHQPAAVTGTTAREGSTCDGVSLPQSTVLVPPNVSG